MQVYHSEAKSIVIITQNRTGSSVLNRLSKDHPDLIAFHCSSFLRHDWKDCLEELEKLEELGNTIYIAVKDPTLRRMSALDMLVGHYHYLNNADNTPLELEDLFSSVTNCCIYLQGFIAGQYKKHKNCPLLDYNLSDTHMDWGNSVLYHLLKVKNIDVTPVMLDKDGSVRSAYLSGPDVKSEVQDRYVVTYISLLYDICSENKEAQEKVTNAMKYQSYMSRANRGMLYDVYCNEFRKLDQTNTSDHIIYTFDDWINFENRCHTAMLKQQHSIDCHESSEDLINEIVSKYTAQSSITRQIVDRNGAYAGCTITERLDEFRRQVYNEEP